MPSKEVDGVVYDTDDAEKIAAFHNNSNTAHHRYRAEVLYRTQSGDYFLYTENGPQGDSIPDWRTGRSQLHALDDEQVLSWCDWRSIDQGDVLDKFSHLAKEDTPNQIPSKNPIFG